MTDDLEEGVDLDDGITGPLVEDFDVANEGLTDEELDLDDDDEEEAEADGNP